MTIYSTRNLCILEPTSLWHLIFINFLELREFNIIIDKIYVRTASSKGAIWDEISEEYQHQSIEDSIFNAPLTHFS